MQMIQNGVGTPSSSCAFSSPPSFPPLAYPNQQTRSLSFSRSKTSVLPCSLILQVRLCSYLISLEGSEFLRTSLRLYSNRLQVYIQMNTFDDDVEELKDGLIICAVARAVETYYLKYVHKTPCMNSFQTGNIWMMEVLQGNDVRCYRMFRIYKDVFYRLSNDLQANYGLKGSRRMNATEILGMFLHMLGHGVENRLAQERFQHSGETVSRYFGGMLDIICKMAIDIIKPMDSEFRGIPQEIRRVTRYMPYFKDCIGAIDGVHVEASIPPSDQVPYIGRKGMPTQNVMAACDFDMQFTFACAGWEDTAHDTRVFLSVLRNPNLNFSKPPNGKYYLVDAGYPQMRGYLGPYKGERYHLPDFRRGGEQTCHKEVFNHMHSSLRSIIE